MSLDITLTAIRQTTVFEANVTHNLSKMAAEAGIYQHLWRPEELKIKKASELIYPLKKAIEIMKADQERFKKLNPENGWGSYDHFVSWLETYLEACRENPDAEISVSR